MRIVRPRSLFLRFFGSFAATVLVVWLGVLAYEGVIIQGKYERVREVENREWARQILIGLRPGAGDPALMRAVTARFVQLRHNYFRDMGWLEPHFRLEVARGGELLYATDSTAGAAPAFGSPFPSGWHVALERDAASGLSVRLGEEVLVVWRFAVLNHPQQLIPLLYSIPFLLVPAWFSIWRGLRPVHEVVNAIRHRSAADLSPLAWPRYRELAPLVDSVNQLMARLADRLARERDFLSDAAHQLKTPLAVIQANADLLAELPEDAPPGPAARAARAGLDEGVRDAAHVTHQLLALARSDRELGAGERAPCDLADLLRARLALAEAPARQRGIELALRAPDSCPLPLHRESAAALIDNLVDNAVKYSPSGANVDVVLERPDAARVRLSVRDHGPGIPPELRARAFERFFRVPGQDQPGSGLGLAIVAQAARTLGARVRLTDNPQARAGAPGLCAVVEWPATGA